jgi:hypothetical protein
MKSLSASEMKKYTWRVELFLAKFEQSLAFELMNGSSVVIEQVSDVEFSSKSRYYDIEGNQYKLTDFAKTVEFGGKASDGTVREDAALTSLNQQLEDIKLRINSHTVPFYVHGNVMEVRHAESTPGTPKSDFHLIDEMWGECYWISHKHGSTPRHFQQWGGISATADKFTNKHEELHSFVNAINKLHGGAMPQATTYYRPIEDEQLKFISVYGKDFYSSGEGRNNVSLVVQGDIKIKQVDGFYEFRAVHMHENRDDVVGNYEPTFYAVYKSDRNDMGIKNCRITINPLDSRGKRTLI